MKTKAKTLLAALLIAGCTAVAQQPPQPPPPPSPEAHLKQVSSKLEKELALNAAQKQKVEAAYKDFFAGMEKLRGDNPPPPPPPPPGKKEDVEKLAKLRDEQIKKALSPTQFKKYVEVEKTMRPPRPPRPPREQPNSN